MATSPRNNRTHAQSGKPSAQYGAKDSKSKGPANQGLLEKVITDVCDERDQLRYALSDAMAKVNLTVLEMRWKLSIHDFHF